MKHDRIKGLLILAVCFLFVGQTETKAQTEISNTDLLATVSPQSSIKDDSDYLPNPNAYLNLFGSNSKVASDETPYQQPIEIELKVSAEVLFKKIKKSDLGTKDLVHFFMKDNRLGVPIKKGFFKFLWSINHVRDFTTDVEKPKDEGTKTVRWTIASMDNGYVCTLIKIKPLGKSDKSGVFDNQVLSADQKSIEIEVTPSTKEGNFRYGFHFEIEETNSGNKRTYEIDPSLKIHQ